jgi:hypothetical protein
VNEVIETHQDGADAKSLISAIWAKPASEVSVEETQLLVARAKAKLGADGYKALLAEWDKEAEEAAKRKAAADKKAREEAAAAKLAEEEATRDEIIEQHKALLEKASTLLTKWVMGKDWTPETLKLAENFLEQLRAPSTDTAQFYTIVRKRRG